jgi:hypothetical protein
MAERRIVMQSGITRHNSEGVLRISTLVFFVMVFTLLICVVGVGFAQNLVTNPAFNGNLNGWSGSLDTTYDGTLDATGIPGSGSAHDTYNDPEIGSKSAMYQCITITSGTKYKFGGKVFVPSEELNLTYGGISLAWFENADCTGPISNAGTLVAHSNTVGQWISLDSNSVTAPPGAQSAKLYGYFGGVSQRLPHNVNFDDMYLEEINTSSIPTLTEWGMVFMSLALAGSAFWMIRRRRIS